MICDRKIPFLLVLIYLEKKFINLNRKKNAYKYFMCVKLVGCVNKMPYIISGKIFISDNNLQKNLKSRFLKPC